MTEPTVAVLMPNYNHARFLEDALRAVTVQSMKPSEVIVVDDGSTDESVDLLQEWARAHSEIRVYRNETNMGVVYTHNRLLRLASSDYVYFLAADDRPESEFLRASMGLLGQHRRAGLCSSLSRIIDETGQDKGLFGSPVITKNPCYLDANQVLTALRTNDSWFMGNTTVYRRQCLLDLGGFDEELRAYFDGFISLVISLKHGACFIPEALGSWRRMDTGYAATCERDAEQKLRTLIYAKHLMLTRYEDLFPADLVNVWERKQLFEWEITRAVEISKRRVSCIERTLESWGAMGRIGYGLARSALRTLSRMKKLYLLIRYRQAIYPVLMHKVRRLVTS